MREKGFRFKDNWWGYVFIAPWLIGFLVFTLYPVISSFVISLFNWDLFGDKIFIGLRNYAELFQGEVFGIALKNTLIYAFFSTFISIVFGILIAYALMRHTATNVGLRTVIYLPCLVIGMAFSMMMQPIFDTNYGLLNRLLASVGIPAQNWLSTPGQAIWVMVIMCFWGLGGPMIVFMAAFKNIAPSITEAARVDGADAFRILVRINIPIITPIIIYQAIMGIIYGVQVFDVAMGLATASGTAQFGMGNNNALATLAYYMYRSGFSGTNGLMGKGSAIGWVIFAITVVFSGLILWFIKKTNYYSLDK